MLATIKKTGPLAPFLFARYNRASQRRAQRLAIRQRQSVTRSDDWIDRHLGFAGKDV